MQLYSWHFEQWWLRWRSVKISAIANLIMWDGIKLKAIKWYKEPEVLFVGWSLKHLLYNYIDYLTFNFTIFDGFPHGPTPWQDGLRARSYSVHCYQFHNSKLSSAHWSAERNPGLWLAERNPSEKEWPGPVLWTLHSFTGIRDVWANTSQLFVSSCSIIRESMEFPSEEVSNSTQREIFN